MNDVLDFPILEAPPPPVVAAPAPAPVAAPAPAAVATVLPSIKDTVLAQFKEAEAGMLVLAEKYRDVAYDVRTTKGMAAAVAARADLRDNGRLALTRAEKKVKADVNDLKRVMADEVDRLVAIVQPVEDAIDGQIKAETQRKADEKAERDRIEAERVDGHRARMAMIGGYLTHCQQHGMTAARIQVGIDRLAAATFGPEWQEFQGPAHDTKHETLEAMRVLHAAAVEREAEALRLEQERQAEADRLEAQRQDQARVAAEQAARAAELAEAQRKLDEAAQALRTQQEEAARIEAEKAALVEAQMRMLDHAEDRAIVAHGDAAQPGVQTPAAQGEVAENLAQSQPGATSTLGDAAAENVVGVDAVEAAPIPATSVSAPLLELTDLERCRIALADACNLLRDWILDGSEPGQLGIRLAVVDKLRERGGLPATTITTNLN